MTLQGEVMPGKYTDPNNHSNFRMVYFSIPPTTMRQGLNQPILIQPIIITTRVSRHETKKSHAPSGGEWRVTISKMRCRKRCWHVFYYLNICNGGLSHGETIIISWTFDYKLYKKIFSFDASIVSDAVPVLKRHRVKYSLTLKVSKYCLLALRSRVRLQFDNTEWYNGVTCCRFVGVSLLAGPSSTVRITEVPRLCALHVVIQLLQYLQIQQSGSYCIL